MKKEEIVDYWLNSSDIDFNAMESLFKNGHYLWTLFVGHLVLEKLLKAYYVKHRGIEIPYTHDLLSIAKKANLIVTDEQADFLDEVTTFNIKARYPDYKNRFYKRATEEFARVHTTRIKEFRLWLLKEIKI